MPPKKNETERQHRQTLKDLKKAIKIFPTVVKEKARASREREKILKNFAPMSRKLLQLEMGGEIFTKTENKIHPWRKCPEGQYWVSSHPLHVQVSERNPAGITTRTGHCRANPSGKDQLYSDEMINIALENFGSLTNLPSANSLGKVNGNEFDQIIAGWTQYWNEVLNPTTPLDPNLIKALISSETDFRVKVKRLASPGNWARGLMQVTDETLNILRDEKGELKNFLINVDRQDIHDPNLNISAGIRWLFHKKALLERRLKRQVTWERAAMEYKGYTKQLNRKEKSAVHQWNKFLERYEKLKND